jgi:hypothetical protein
MGDDYLQVQLVVTIRGFVPANGGTVTLVCLDPPNESGTGAANNDGLLKNLPPAIVFTPGGPVTQYITAKVGQKAGDNYKVTATGGTIPKTVETKKQLTVWRRLWVELDQMAMPTETVADGFDPNLKGIKWSYPHAIPSPEPDDFDVLFQPQKPDISVLTSAMVKACIDVREATPAIITSWGLTSRETTPFVHNTTNTLDGPTTVGNPSRDVTVNNASFWCIQGVGAYEDTENADWDWNTSAEIGDEPTRGVAKPNAGIFLVFQEAIRDYAKSGKYRFNYDPVTKEVSYPILDTNKPLEYYITLPCKRNADELNKLVTFHEVLHFFGFYDKDALSYDPNIDGEIMTKYWFFTEIVPPSVLTLSPAQIARIQSKDYPH